MLRRFAGVSEAGARSRNPEAISARDLGVKAFADVAQLVEHSLGKGEVTSSILVIGSIGWLC
jgi:hypothetical protein